MSCKVKNCRYPHSHVTKNHLCSKCNKYGHGQMECNNQQLKDELKKYFNETLPKHLHCTFNGCTHAKFHSNLAHHCSKCFERHATSDCTINNGIVQDIIQKYLNELNYISNNKYVSIYCGMGCLVYVRKTNYKLDGIFMHSDSWGQYGPATDETPRFNKFIENLTETNLNNTIKCPLCRTINKINLIQEINDCEDKCVICYTNNISILFNECKHKCVCKSCYEKL